MKNFKTLALDKQERLLETTISEKSLSHLQIWMYRAWITLILFGAGRLNKRQVQDKIIKYSADLAKTPSRWGEYFAELLKKNILDAKITEILDKRFFSIIKPNTLNACNFVYNFIVNADTDIFINIFYDSSKLYDALHQTPMMTFGKNTLYIYANGTNWADTASKKCKFLALFCNQLNLSWDLTDGAINNLLSDNTTITALVDAFKNTKFFKRPKKKTTQTQNAQTQNTSGATAKQPPKSNYKSSGPQSANVPALIGTVGSKQALNLSGDIYWIVADKTGKNVPHAFVHPVENSAAGEKAKINNNQECLVFFGSGNGYTDCTCFFTDNTIADSFLQKLIQQNSNAQQAKNLRVVKQRVDQNGYYEVKTEYGISVYIKALKLNEDLEDEDFIDFPYSEEEYKKGYQINDTELFTEWLQKSIS